MLWSMSDNNMHAQVTINMYNMKIDFLRIAYKWGSRCSNVSCTRFVDAHPWKQRSLWWGKTSHPLSDGWTVLQVPHYKSPSCWLISLIVLIESHPSPAVNCANVGRQRNGDRAAKVAHFIKSEPSACLSHSQSCKSRCPSLNTHP